MKIKNRIDKLEAMMPQPPSERDIQTEVLYHVLTCVIAFHLGGPFDPEGSPAEHYARALRYNSSGELRIALERDDPDHDVRRRDAIKRLCEKFNLNSDSWPSFLAGVWPLYEAVPDLFKRT